MVVYTFNIDFFCYYDIITIQWRFFMSKITTEDCKLFLLDLYKDKKVAYWKRIRKFKDENGDICREFSHSDGITVFLIEKNCQLSVLTLQSLSSFKTQSIGEISQKLLKSTNISLLAPVTETADKSNKKAIFTLFDGDAQKSAKRLINAFVKPKEDPIEPDSSAKGFYAIPNLIYFSFLEDANCDETEYLSEISTTMQYDAPMRNITVFFMPSTIKSLCQHLAPLVEPFINIALTETEEMTFKLFGDSLTVTDVFEHLTQAGFVYNPDGCALKSLFMNYQLINTAPIVNLNDKTAEYKKSFLSALKKDDVEKMKVLIYSGLPLNLKVGGQSLLAKTMNENKLECFKYLVSLYTNTANIGNGMIDQVWENVWWPNDCSVYFMANASYDFTDSNKHSHRHLVSTLVHHSSYFEIMKDRVNIEFFSVACLESTLTYDRAYPVFKDFVKKAIDEYPSIVSASKDMVEQLEHGFIIPSILELLAGSSCTFSGKSVFEVVQAKIDEIAHDPKGYRDNIETYKVFLKKYGR